MCGIFGVSAILDGKRSLNLKNLRNELKVFVNISKKRGSDTFGFLIRSEKENYIYKINENPSKAIQRNDMKNLLNYGFLNKEIKKITVIGQTRLVTNGSKFSNKNNQPLITKNVIGVHNGIFTDFELDSTETINKEGNTINSDSLLFYEKLSSFYDNKNFVNDFIKLIKISKGNFSIAYTLKNHNHIFLASNCGSLFYYYDKDSNFFAYSSEKDMLINYIKRSPIFNKIKKSFDINLINQCLNQIIIYDPSKNDISVINYFTNNKIEHEINFNNNISKYCTHNYTYK